MARKSDNATMSELLRQALRESESLRAIATQTGIQRASLQRFRDGSQSLRLDVADRLAEFFEIECRRTRRERN